MYRIGCAKADITPPLGMPFLSGVPRHAPISGVHDPLFARAACIEAGGSRVVVVSADTIGFANSLLGEGRSFTGEVKRAIERATGIPASHVMLASNHIHSSAETLSFRPLRATYAEAQAWLEMLQATLSRCAVAACAGSAEVELRIGRGMAPGLSYNRRGEEALDEEVTVLVFASDHGPELVLANYACHPVIVQAQPLVSADYVGAMVNAVEESVPSLRACQFLLGACGDIDPSVGATRRFADVEPMGRALAEHVLRLILSAGRGDEPAVVRAASAEIEFPSRPLPTPQEAAGTVDEEELVRIAEGDGPFREDVQVIRIGDAVLAGVPGEAFSAVGYRIKALCAPRVGVPVTCANGYLGYFAPPEAWKRGGYEVGLGPWSKVGPEAPAILVTAVKGLLEKVAY